MHSIKLASAVAAASLALTATTGTATADDGIEIGGFVGAHLFNDDNELGVDDQTDPESPANSIAFGIRVGYAFHPLLTAEAEIALMPTETRGNATPVTVLGWRAHGLVHFTEGRLRPFGVLGVGFLTSSPRDQNSIRTDTDLLLHVGVGAKYRIQDNWGVRADVRLLLPPSSADEFVTTDWELLVGLYKTFGHGDDDPELGPASGDSDGDKIADDVDKCPNDAEDPDGFEDDDGCPDDDNDGDGVPDSADRCATEKETPNNYQDGDGCPDTIPAAVSKFTGTIKGINFRFGSADIAASSFPILDEAASVLSQFGTVNVEVQGHTDNMGTRQLNVRLSQQRADAVVAYLVGKGVAESRLRAVGYGPDKPIADNATTAGRAQNRRVDFVLITQ